MRNPKPLLLVLVLIAAAPTTQPVPRNDLPGLSNFAQVSPVLYRGAQPTAEGFVQLKKMGIKTVVNLRSFHSDREELKGTGLQYVHIYAKAWHMEDEYLVTLLKVIEDPANQPVFVHCQQGSDRTGCAVAVYRIVQEGWSVKDAAAELPTFGFHPIWKNIKEYLGKFDAAKMKEKVQQAPAVKVETIN